jgi:hypothetical protein
MLWRQACARAARSTRGSVALGLVVGTTAALLAVTPGGASADPTRPPIVVPSPPGTAVPTSDPTGSSSPPVPTTTDPAPTASPTDGPTTAPPGTGSAPPGGTDSPPASAPGASAPTTPSLPTTSVPPPAAGNDANPMVVPRPAAVTMSAFDAASFVFKGTRQVRTSTGTLTVLWFQAARAHAAGYRLRSVPAGPAMGLSGDMDLTGADVYATRFTGTVSVPGLDIAVAEITLRPDSVPTWLRLDLVLPAFDARDVTLEQAWIAATTLDGTHLSATT